MKLSDATDLIKGEKGTKVYLTVKRVDGGVEQVVVTRDVVELEETYAKSSIINDDLSKYGLINLDQAIRNIHFADSTDKLNKAIHRLKFDEHFFLQILMALRRSSVKQIKTKPFKKIGPYLKIILDNLDFELTGSQKKVIKEIKDDMARPYSMNRLLQGDVGSGKTIVAILASVIAVTNNAQIAVMAPTEILANQHFKAFKKLLDNIQVTCATLVGGAPKKERKSILKGLENGQINIIIITIKIYQVFLIKLNVILKSLRGSNNYFLN